MKKIFKKNQIMIVALALMIAVAGYLNFAGNKDDDIPVTSSGVYNDGTENALLDISEDDIESLDAEYVEITDEYLDEDMAELTNEELNAFVSETVDSDNVEAQMAETASGDLDSQTVDEVPGEAVFTSVSAVGNLSDAKLAKEQIRSKNKASLLEIINNTNLTDEQKQSAVNKMIEMTDLAEKEMSSEILLEAKGYDNAVVSISDGTADVCVAAASLTDVQCAQIIDIVQRKTGISAENIVITPVAQ